MNRPYKAFARLRVIACTGLLTLAAGACGGNGEAAPRVALSDAQAGAAAAQVGPAQPVGGAVTAALPPRARMALDSGNLQMREKRYADALASYQVAAREAPGHTAPEFGVFIAAQRLGNKALADSAQRIIDAHTRGSPTWTDSTMRRAHGERPLPKSHPTI